MEDQEREAAIDAEQDDELDLNLGLRMAPRRRILHLPNPENPAVSDDWSDLSLTTRSEKESNRLGFPELRAKMEAQALRRQEARRKRDDKRKSKANAMAGNANERLLWFESRRAAGRESEGSDSERRRKGGNCNDNGAEGGTAATTSFSVRSAGEFDRSQLNVLPYLIIPGLAGSNGDAIHPVVGVGVPGAGELRPYQVEEKNSGLVVGGVSDQLKRSVSSCSRVSSSGVSDYQSTSGQGGSSSDGGSHSSHSYPLDLTIKNCPTMSNDTQIHTSHHNSQPSAPQLNDSTSTNSINGKVDRGFSFYQIKPTQILKRVPSQTNSSHHDQSQTSPSKKPMPTRRTRSPCQVTNRHKLGLSKPPKPKGHQSNGTVLLPNMRRVATTGNGPNGKRITGFLYKYTNLEVSIVCICHGTSFSPTGFVEHAGGVGIENPLRHITISPPSSN